MPIHTYTYLTLPSFTLYISIAELDNMFFITLANSVLVVYFRRFQVSQILEYSSPHLPTGSFKWSKYDRMFNFVCHDGHPDQFWYLNILSAMVRLSKN